MTGKFNFRHFYNNSRPHNLSNIAPFSPNPSPYLNYQAVVFHSQADYSRNLVFSQDKLNSDGEFRLICGAVKLLFDRYCCLFFKGQ